MILKPKDGFKEEKHFTGNSIFLLIRILISGARGVDNFTFGFQEEVHLFH